MTTKSADKTATGTSDWSGDWHTGHGTISTASPAIDHAAYTYTTRFVDDNGVAPEELLAAAHASCFNQALANNLDRARLVADWISTTVDIDYGLSTGRPTVHSSHITVSAHIPGASEEAFRDLVEQSARGCSISRVLNCEITTSATLVED